MRFNRIFLMITILLIGYQSTAWAQCATLTVTPSQLPMIPCDTTTSLTISFNAVINLNFPVKETDTYSVNQIPYAPLPWVGSNTVLNGNDDIWSGLVPLPFSFCFFGNVYNSYVIGSNGRITFDAAQANQYDAWSTAGPPVITAPEPLLNTMNNTIMAPYHDTDPSVGGSITWDTFGVAPCRTMVINWTSVPMFSCNTLIDSQQIVLHEFSNVIDINIASKPTCATWNTGLALEGIQNATGTTAFTVPGRNNTVWTANNDSWSFEPAGNDYTFTTTYTWRNGVTNSIIGTGPNLTINMPFPTSIICEAAIFGGCTNDTTYARDTTFFLPGKVSADFDMDVRLGCTSDTVNFTNTTVPMNNVSFFWDFGDANFSSATNPSHVYGAQNVYNVTLIASHPVCIGDTITKPVNLNHPIDALFTASPDSICLGDQIIISNVSQPSYILFNNDWDMGDGTTFTNNFPVFNHTYLNAGVYPVKLLITDTLGCVDSLIRDVFVEETPYVEMMASPKDICVGETVYFVDSAAPHTISTQYDYGDGNIVANKHNPTHTYQQAGNYNVTYTGYYLVCPEAIATENIIVNDYPAIDLGPDTAICPGKTNPIVLSNNLNNSQIMDWSDGSTGNSLTVTEFGRYWAMANNGACASTDSIWVKRDCYLNIPNAFSPDGDGLNDYFIPRQLLSEGLQTFEMKIFNRWGELIFTTDKIDGRGWDGKYGGIDQPMGVYVYYIEAKWSNGYTNTFQGNMTLVR